MRLAVAIVPIATVLACSSPCGAAKAAPPPADQPNVVDRYTRDIWPAVAAYNADHAQGGPASQAFTATLAPDMNADQFGKLRDAAQALGRMWEHDQGAQTTHYNDGLHLSTVDTQNITSETATLDVCYTYTHYWYVDIADTHQAPGASEAIFGMSNQGGSWLLGSISNDHVVPSCPSDKT
jgi:hypothetical protein